MISEEYRAEQEHLHQNPNYGVMSTHYAPHVAEMCRIWKCDSILDYGAGKQRLKEGLDEHGFNGIYFPYDPAIPEISSIPPAEWKFVACIDVLEHIEPEFLDDVLNDLQKHTHFRGLFTVHTGPAVKTLRDGRNAHLIQQPKEWWLPKIEERFDVLGVVDRKNGFEVIVQSKKWQKPTSNGGNKA